MLIKALAIGLTMGVTAAYIGTPPPMFIGRATVVDGDTIEVQGQRIRLWGIDAPEARQPGGKAAAQALDAFLSAATPVVCYQRDKDRYRRVVGMCFRVDGVDVAKHMVTTGNAVDWPRYSKGYYAEWQTLVTFEKPWNGE